MSVVSWIAIGGLAGLVVLRVKRGRLPGRAPGAVATGITGGLLGGGVFAVLDGRGVTTLDPVTGASALVGAVVMLAAMGTEDPAEPHTS